MAKKNFKNPAEMFLSGAEDKKSTSQAKEQDAPGVDVPKGYKLVKETKSERMQLLVRPTLKDTIKKEADRQGLSMNDLVNDIFEEYIERISK